MGHHEREHQRVLPAPVVRPDEAVHGGRIVEPRRVRVPDGAPFTYVDEDACADEVTPIGVVADPHRGRDEQPSACSIQEFRVDDIEVEREALEQLEMRRRLRDEVIAACGVPSWMMGER